MQALDNAAPQALPHLADVPVPSTLPSQALNNAAPQAHLPIGLPANDFHFEPSILPSQAVDNAASQAHLPTDLPAFISDAVSDPPPDTIPWDAPQAVSDLQIDLSALLNEATLDLPPLPSEAPVDLPAFVLSHFSDGLLS